MLASRTATTTGRRPQQEQEWSQASQQREQQFPTWQQENPERPQQRQHQRPARPQHQVPQPRPPEQPWQPLREVQQQLEALQVDDGEPSGGAWRGEDPPNRVIREDVMDRVHDRLDKQAWGNKPSAGPSFGAGPSSMQASGGGAAGFAYGPSFGQNLQLDSYIDNFINQPNGGLPQRTNPTYQIPPRNQNVADGRGQLGARAAHHAAPRNAPLQTAPNPPPSWGASAYDQWGQAHVDDWGGPSRNSNNAHNGHMAVLNWQANGFAPNFPQANVGASGSSLVDNTYAANAASQPPQNSRSNFPVSRYAPPLRRNGFGDYRGPTMRVLRKNGVDKLVRDG